MNANQGPRFSWNSNLNKTVFSFLLVISVIVALIFVYRKTEEFFDLGSTLEYSQNPNDKDAKIFVEYGYGEIKSIASQFLTITVSVIMISITFSEKIIDLKTAGYYTRFIFVISLGLLVSSLISTEIGLFFNSYSYATALYDVENYGNSSSSEFYEDAYRGISLMIFGGVIFVSGIGFLILTALVSIFAKKAK